MCLNGISPMAFNETEAKPNSPINDLGLNSVVSCFQVAVPETLVTRLHFKIVYCCLTACES